MNFHYPTCKVGALPIKLYPHRWHRRGLNSQLLAWQTSALTNWTTKPYRKCLTRTVPHPRGACLPLHYTCITLKAELFDLLPWLHSWVWTKISTQLTLITVVKNDISFEKTYKLLLETFIIFIFIHRPLRGTQLAGCYGCTYSYQFTNFLASHSHHHFSDE